jgi:thioredoxin-like negative regulator of GroEL
MPMLTPFSVDDPENREAVQEAFEAFLAATSVEEMDEVVEDYPFVTEPAFEAGVNRMIEHASRVGEAEAIFRLQEQLALLQEVAGVELLSPEELAVEEFVYAEEEADAVSIFEENADFLRSDQATQMIFALEAGDPESHLHLEARRQLWRKLAGRE